MIARHLKHVLNEIGCYYLRLLYIVIVRIHWNDLHFLWNLTQVYGWLTKEESKGCYYHCRVFFQNRPLSFTTCLMMIKFFCKLLMVFFVPCRNYFRQLNRYRFENPVMFMDSSIFVEGLTNRFRFMYSVFSVFHSSRDGLCHLQ